jgi:hypothetical protein
VNPEAYLADVLVRVGTERNVEALMPWSWTPSTKG